jgi:hypothetical protein
VKKKVDSYFRIIKIYVCDIADFFPEMQMEGKTDNRKPAAFTITCECYKGKGKGKGVPLL